MQLTFHDVKFTYHASDAFWIGLLDYNCAKAYGITSISRKFCALKVAKGMVIQMNKKGITIHSRTHCATRGYGLWTTWNGGHLMEGWLRSLEKRKDEKKNKE